MLRWSWIAAGVWVWCGLAAPGARAGGTAGGRADHLRLGASRSRRVLRLAPADHAGDRRLPERYAVFERMYSPVTSSFGAHSSVLSSSSPVEHALVSLGPPRSPWKPSSAASSVAEHLAGQRYRCAAFVSTRHIGTWSGLQAGLPHPRRAGGKRARSRPRSRPWPNAGSRCTPRSSASSCGCTSRGQEPNLPAMPCMTMLRKPRGLLVRRLQRHRHSARALQPGRIQQPDPDSHALPQLEGMVTPKGMRLQDVDRAAVERLYNRYDGDPRATDDAARCPRSSSRPSPAARTVVAMCSVTGQAFGEQTMLCAAKSRAKWRRCSRPCVHQGSPLGARARSSHWSI